MKKAVLNIVKEIIDRHLSIFFLCLFLLTCKLGMAQNIDFRDLNASYTQCYTGSHDNPCQNPCSPILSRHELITAAFMEPQTNNNVMIDVDYIKLGNPESGSNAEGIRYTFTVNPSYCLLKVDFVAILQDHGHARADQAYFKIRILDCNGNEMSDECSSFEVFPSVNSDYIVMNPVPEVDDDIKYAVSQILLNLDRYVNKCIIVEFTTADCNLNEHFGYAYYKAELMAINFNLSSTSAGWNTSAPDGFLGYKWSNGATTSGTNYPRTDSIFCCTFNPEQPCPIMVCKNREGRMIDPDPDPDPDTVGPIIPPVDVYDTIKVCEDSEFYWYLMDTAIVVDKKISLKYEKWSGSHIDTIFHLFLEPYLKYYHINDIKVCMSDGEYHGFGFDIDSLYIDMPPDTLFGRSVYECDSITILRLTVIPPLNPGYIDCDTIVMCEKIPQYYEVVDPPDSTNRYVNYRWLFPPEVTGSSYGRKVQLTIDTGVVNPVEIQVVRTTVCDTDTLSINVYHNSPYRVDYYDSVKVGHEYVGYGFTIPPSYSVGIISHPNHNFTIHGCDSSIYLHLTTYKPLSVKIRPMPPEICEGDVSVLYATGEFSGVENSECPPMPVNIGDFLLSDESTCRPGELGGRTPIAVVFYVNSSGWHGSAVSLVAPTDNMWGRDGEGMCRDIEALTNYSTAIKALLDVNGNQNTYWIKSSGGEFQYPAAHALSAETGWYFPALGQVCQLLHNSYIVNQSLMQIGADLLEAGVYWSSTEGPKNDEGTKSQAWYMDKNSGALKLDSKEKYHKIRSIRDF